MGDLGLDFTPILYFLGAIVLMIASATIITYRIWRSSKKRIPDRELLPSVRRVDLSVFDRMAERE